MKSSLLANVVLVTAFSSCFASFAQPGAMPARMVPAIQQHLQQKRTLEQREAIDRKTGAPKTSQRPVVNDSKNAQQPPPVAVTR
jgi:hypothetical protein